MLCWQQSETPALWLVVWREYGPLVTVYRRCPELVWHGLFYLMASDSSICWRCSVACCCAVFPILLTLSLFLLLSLPLLLAPWFIKP